MNEYLKIFIDKDYPSFLEKYFSVKTLERIKHVTQFCGCDYTSLYDPRFYFTRFDHSLVVAHITWHFTHDKKATLAALLHDSTIPCFAHAIDVALGDSVNQESSESSLVTFLQNDSDLSKLLEEDDLKLEDLEDLSQYPILENKSPKLCSDRLDGVLHTTYVWLNRSSIEEIKRIYDDLVVLKNENGHEELGFKTIDVALEFVQMTKIYALELQGNRDKFVIQYVADVVNSAIENELFTKEDLYIRREDDIVSILEANFSSWKKFTTATDIESFNVMPSQYNVSVETKRRNVIPLVDTVNGPKRIDMVSKEAMDIYKQIETFRDKKYACVKGLDSII